MKYVNTENVYNDLYVRIHFASRKLCRQLDSPPEFGGNVPVLFLANINIIMKTLD